MDLDQLKAAIARQGAKVRELKQPGQDTSDLAEAIKQLQQLKLDLEERTPKVDNSLELKNRKALDDLLLRKMYLVPSFEIYGGTGGFYDFGPVSCALKANILNFWRRHFVLNDNMLEIECTNIMPEVVLKTSGHVDRFTDLMVKDMKNGECYRADKLLEDHIDRLLSKEGHAMTDEVREQHRLNATRAESMTPEEIHQTFQTYGIKSPSTGTELSEPVPFNLMFSCAIGPEGGQVGYLRPETAQGIFLNFRRLLEYNAGKMPFAVAQVGNAFRNEISPRMGLIRVREFQQAEIEYFVHPEQKQHANYESVAGNELVLFPKTNQLTDGKTVTMKVRDAVKQGIIANEALAYFVARTALFVERIGVDPSKVRFRQHLDTEMAHYATDCWDLEIYMMGSWIECAGHADRSCYDLQVHAKKSKVEMVGTLKYDAPRQVQVIDMKANRGLIGRQFKKEAAVVNEALEDIRSNNKLALDKEQELAQAGKIELGPLCNGQTYTITREMVSFKEVTKTMNEEKFVPSVIEPSFGVGRILSAVFEHCFYTREGDEKRAVMAFAPFVAPIKASVLPLSANAAFEPFIAQLEESLLEAGLSSKTDSSTAAIGRRYSRADELGIPFNITVDFDTVATNTVTLRERDSCAQVRLHLDHVAPVIQSLVSGKSKWADIMMKYPVVRSSDEDEAAADTAAPTKIEVTTRGRFHRPSGPVTENILAKQNITSMKKSPSAAVAPPAAPVAEAGVDQAAVDALVTDIVAVGDAIRVLKTEGASKEQVMKEVNNLLALKVQYKELTGQEYISPNQGSSKKNKKKK